MNEQNDVPEEWNDVPEEQNDVPEEWNDVPKSSEPVESSDVAEEATEGERLDFTETIGLIGKLGTDDMFDFFTNILIDESAKRQISVSALPAIIEGQLSGKIGYYTDIPLIKELNELGIIATITKTEDNNIEIVLGHFGTWSKDSGFIVNENINYRLTDDFLDKCLVVIDKYYEDTIELINKLNQKENGEKEKPAVIKGETILDTEADEVIVEGSSIPVPEEPK